MNTLNLIATRANSIMAEPKPLPSEVTDALDTVKLWIQTIGGSIAIIGLLVLAIGLFFAHRHGAGQEFMGKLGWWMAGAVLFGIAGVIAPIFLGF